MSGWLCISVGIAVDDWYYFAISNGNALFKCHFDSETLVFLGQFPGELSNPNQSLFNIITHYEHYLIFWRYNAYQSCLYDLESDRFVQPNVNTDKLAKIERVILHNNKFYIFGHWSNPYIYKYDLEKETGSFIIYNLNMLKNGICVCPTGLDYDDEMVYIPEENEHLILFNWKSEQIQIVELQKMQMRYVELTLVDHQLYLLDEKGGLVCYNIETNMLQTAIELGTANEVKRYVQLRRDGKKIFMFPYGKMGKLIRYDTETGLTEIGNPIFSSCDHGYTYVSAGVMYTYSEQSGVLGKIDLHSLQKKQILLKDSFHVSELCQLQTAKNIFVEKLGKYSTLNNFIFDYIMKAKENKATRKDGLVGKCIYYETINK